MNIKKIIFALSFCAFSLTLIAQVSFGSPEKINDGWRFSLTDNADYKNPEFIDNRWWRVDLPHDWSVKMPLSPANASCQGFLPGGVGWYRKSLDISADKAGERVYLYFEGAYNRSEVFVNGQSVGSRPNGYVSFAFDVTAQIKFGERNTIAVRIDHSRAADSRWYTGSGIYRNVYLVYANPVHIAQWGVFAYPSVEKKAAVLNVEVEIQNQSEHNADLQIVNELFDKEGKKIAENSKKMSISAKTNSSKISTQIAVKNPKLWDLENPNLYTLKTTVLQKGKVVDKTETTTGFRSFTFDADKGFSLNGKNVKMKGVCIHHDAGVLGAAVPREVWKRRLQTLKAIGVNALRTSHNPQAPDLYELADEIGFLILDEAFDEWEYPKRKWLEGWNAGIPGMEGSFDIFNQWGERDMEDIVRRDRNHLSIFAYSIGNEVDYPNDPYSHPILGGTGTGFTQATYGGYKKDAPDANRLGDIAKKLVAAVKKYDKSRPVTAGLAGVAMSNETQYPSTLDICGYNYTENKYQSDHEKYPQRVLFGSETRHELSAWKYTRDLPYVFGQFLWTGIDYLGESGRYPSRGFYSGLLDFGGFVKPRGYFRQSLWAAAPMIYAGTYPTPIRGARGGQLQDVWSQSDEAFANAERVPSMDAWSVWNYIDNQPIRVVVYTNAKKSKLLLNGSQVGETKSYNDETGIIFWDIPYKAGKLEAIGLDENNKEVSRYAIETSSRPHKIQVLFADKQLNKGGVAQIAVQITDEKGVPVMLCDDEIVCTVSHGGQLLGLEASNNSDMGDYTDNAQRAFHGRLLAYVKANESGTFKVQLTANWLQSAEVEIEVK